MFVQNDKGVVGVTPNRGHLGSFDFSLLQECEMKADNLIDFSVLSLSQISS